MIVITKNAILNDEVGHAEIAQNGIMRRLVSTEISA
jgi:hypothetical protein